MPKRHKKFHLGVFGESGNGKTTYAMKFVAHAGASCVFLFDPEGDFAADMKLRTVTQPHEIDAAIQTTGWVCYDPGDMFPGEVEQGLEYFATLAYRASQVLPGRKFFVVDELGSFMTGNVVPKPLKIVLQRGRHFGLDGVFIAQQPNELHNTVRSQLTEFVCFQLTDDTALEIPKKWGFNVETLKKLPPFHYICRNKRGAESRSF